MIHGVSAPRCLVDKLKSDGPVEPFRPRMGVIDEQAYRLRAMPVDSFTDKHRGDAPLTEILLHAQRVEIILAGLRLIIHTGEVPT